MSTRTDTVESIKIQDNNNNNNIEQLSIKPDWNRIFSIVVRVEQVEQVEQLGELLPGQILLGVML